MKNKSRKQKNRLLVSTYIALCLVGFFFTLQDKQVEKTISASDQTYLTQDEQEQRKTPEPFQIDNDQLLNSEFQLPIFMYHHIRNYNDPNDKPGTNLSVSLENFAKQLDQIKSNGYTTITFEDLKIGNVPEKSIILTFDDGYDNFYYNAYPELKSREMKSVTYIITDKINKNGYMTDNQIVELTKTGFEIGSHTVNHLDLSKINSEAVVAQLKKSKEILEQLTEKPVLSLCYPSGKYNDNTKTIAKDNNYIFAVTTKNNITSFIDYYALNRYRINPDTSISKYLK